MKGFEISRWELRENRHGKNDLVIRQVKIIDEQGKFIKLSKINEELKAEMEAAPFILIKQKK